MARFAILITHENIVSKIPTVEDLQTILRKYTRREVVNFLGKMNCLLTTWQNEPNVERDAANKTPFTSMSTSGVPLLRKAQPGSNLVKEKFEEFAQAMEKDLFGSDATSQDAAT